MSSCANTKITSPCGQPVSRSSLFGKTLGWWYWLGVVVLLGAWLGGNPWAAYGVAVLCLVQWLHFIALERSFVAFPVQVRGGFLLMLLGGFWEPLRFLHWVQLVGTTAFSHARLLPARSTALAAAVEPQGTADRTPGCLDALQSTAGRQRASGHADRASAPPLRDNRRGMIASSPAHFDQ
jgi:hypothetical protein